jgi:hypothetical protein
MKLLVSFVLGATITFMGMSFMIIDQNSFGAFKSDFLDYMHLDIIVKYKGEIQKLNSTSEITSFIESKHEEYENLYSARLNDLCRNSINFPLAYETCS